jgi:hypothetical protein
MKKIEGKIASVAVLMPADATRGANVVYMHEKVERSDVLSGLTYKIRTPLAEQSFYITINDIVLNAGTEHEQRRPFEVFINSKNMEAFQWIVALTRMISAVFRKGGDVTFIAEEMRSIFDPRGGFIAPGGRFVPSLVAEIGLVIERHLLGLGLIQREEMSPDVKAALEQKKVELGDAMKNAAQCPKCMAIAFVVQSGCGTCLECSYSKCG